MLTATETGAQLDRLVVAGFRPPYKPDDAKWVKIVAEFADALGAFTLEQIKGGISALIRDRKERTWPTPAEISGAIRCAPAVDNGPKESLADKLRKRDDARRQDARDIAQNFEMANRSLYEMARSEGWLASLVETVRDAARMIALRNESRSLGRFVSLTPQTCGGVFLENIRCDNEVDYIAIRPEDIAEWRAFQEIAA